MKICKLLLATVGASVLLGALVSTATARNFSISNQNISAMWRSVEFSLPSGAIRCQVTIEGSFHTRTIQKVAGSLIGYITRAILGPCAAGTATILTSTLPWHGRYSGFEGSLPLIRSTTLHIIGAAFRASNGSENCLATSTAARPAIAISHRNTATHEVTEVGVNGRLATGIECLGIEGTMSSDSGAVSLLGTSSVRISVTLI